MAQAFDAQAVAVAENKFEWIGEGVKNGVDYAKARSQIESQRAVIEAQRLENQTNQDIMATKSMESDIADIEDIYQTLDPARKRIKIKLFEEKKRVQGKQISPVFKEVFNDDSFRESFKKLDELMKDPEIQAQYGKQYEIYKEMNSIYGSPKGDNIFKSFIDSQKVSALAQKADSEAAYKEAMAGLAEKRGGLIDVQKDIATEKIETQKATTGLTSAKTDATKAGVGLTAAKTEATKAGVGQKDRALGIQEKAIDVKKDWQLMMKDRYADLDEDSKKRLQIQDKAVESKIKTDNKRLDIMAKASEARATKASGIPAGTVKGYVDKLGTKGEASKRSDKYRAQIDASTAALNDFKKRRSKDSLMAVTAALASAYGMGSGRALSDKDIEMLQSSTGLNDLSQLKAYVMNDTQNVLNSKVFDNMVQALRNSIETSKQNRVREAGALLETEINTIPKEIIMPGGKKAPILLQWEADLGVEVREDKNGRLYLLGKPDMAKESGSKEKTVELSDSQKEYIKKAKEKYSYEDFKKKAKQKGVDLKITQKQWDAVLP